MKAISHVTDLFLFDIKHMDRKKHVRFTGKDNTLILDNLRRLSEIHSNVVARYPLIPGYNDSDKEMFSLVHFIK